MTQDNQDTNMKPMPRHVAIIMDGNGRWAKSKGYQRSFGHIEGVKTVRRITETASEMGIKYLTLYAFSTENWNRPKEEVDALLSLIVSTLEKETPDLIKNNVKLEVIGDISRMQPEALSRLKKCIELTSKGTGLTLVIAFSYSSRWEIVRACRKIAEKVRDGVIRAEDIDDNVFEASLTTASYPDPDLLIRTGGDFRVSNFLLWQIAYAEIFVTPVFWPDFSRENFIEAVDNFRSRERRFGLTSEQINHDAL